MALRDLFGSAKKTARKAERDLERGKEYGQKVYDRDVRGAMEAHQRGSSEVAERFGRANKRTAEFAERSFGFDEDTEFQVPAGDSGGDSMGMGADIGIDPTQGGDASDTVPGVPDVMGQSDEDDRMDLW